MRRFDQLLRTLDEDKSPESERDRSAIITAFNEQACQLREEVASADGPLSSVVYAPPFRAPRDIEREVAQSMATLPWTKTFGLSFNEVMALPRDTYRTLLNVLIEDSAKETPEALFQVTCIRRLTDIIDAIITRKISDQPPTGES